MAVSDVETDEVEYMSSERVDVKLLTQTSAATLNAAVAPVLSVVINARQARPYLPGNIQINDVLYPDIVENTDNYTLTFSHRDRVLQSNSLFDCRLGDIGQEVGVEYSVTIFNKTNEIAWTTTTSQTLVTLPYHTKNSEENAPHHLQLKSVRNGIESLYSFSAALPDGVVVLAETRPPIISEGETGEQ